MIFNCFIVFIFGIIIGIFSNYLVSNKISFLYLLISGILSILIFFKYKYSLNAIMYLIVLFVMIFISIYDIKTFTIPNIFIVIGLINRLVFIMCQKENLIMYLLNGIGISFPILLLSLLMSKIFNKEMMGGGDIKLLFMLGTYFNIYQNVCCLLLSSIFALVYIFVSNKNKDRIAFGPFINVAFYLMIII